MSIVKNVNIIKQEFSFDFRLLHCGYETESANASPASIDRYVFNYVTDGCGKLVINKQTFNFKKGDVFIIPKQTLFYQINSTKTPYSYYYVALSGANINLLFEKANLTASSPVITSVSNTIEICTKKIYDLLKENSFYSIAQANCEFMNILCQLYKSNPQNMVSKSSNNEIHAQKILLYIEKNYANDFLISDISKALHLNRTYIPSLFKNEFGVTIKEFLTKYRLDKAAFLLTTTDDSIAKIAQNTGFNDYVNFFKAFKKIYKCSPNFYRKIYHNEHNKIFNKKNNTTQQ